MANTLALNCDRLGELERNAGLRREFHVLSTGGARGCKSASPTDAGADGCSFAAAGKAADERADHCAAASDDRSALAFTLLCSAITAGRDHVALAVNFDARQTNCQIGFTFEGALLFCVDDRSRDVRPLGDGDLARDDYGLGDGGFKIVAGLGHARADGRRQHHGDGGACRNDDGLWGLWSRSGLLRSGRLARALLAAVGGWIC